MRQGMRSAVALVVLGWAACMACVHAQMNPFTYDAEGWASGTQGGKGGRIIRVTHLNAAGAGSLREALEATSRMPPAEALELRLSRTDGSHLRARVHLNPVAGLPDADDIAPADTHRDLQLFHPWAITSEEAAEMAKACEAAAFKTHRRITNSEGAGVSAQQSHFFSAHTRGFRGGYASSRHSLSVSPIAGKGDDMQRDAWYSSMRDAAELASPQAIGRYAAERALSRLHARKIATVECPVLFESPLAAGLLGAFVQAISGGALYRKSSYLLDSLGKQVFPKHIDIAEDPFVLRGKAVNNCACFISGAVIDDNDFEIGVGRAEQGLKSLSDSIGFVASSNDDAKAWK